MSRQFTDGEIEAAIKALAAEGKALTRASVRNRLGGGGSTRISALLKEYDAGAHGRTDRSGPSGPPVRTGPSGLTPPPEEGRARGAVDSPSTGSTAPTMAPIGEGHREPEGSVAQLQSEIRVLKILLESERNARREDEARNARTIEALQREIEIASRA